MDNLMVDRAAALAVAARRPAEEHLAATAEAPQAAIRAGEIRADIVLAEDIPAEDIQAAAVVVHPAEAADIPVVEAVVRQVAVAPLAGVAARQVEAEAAATNRIWM